MGLFNALRELCFRNPPIPMTTEDSPRSARKSKSAMRTSRRCQIESLEPRRLFATDVAPQVLLGSVYFEEATGDDSQPDIIEVSFVGGAAGTKLDRLVINGDKREDGLTDGDIFFDTAAGGIGAFEYRGLSITSANGFTVDSVTVVDGGTQIVFTLSGFDAGEKLVFSVDADEAQYVGQDEAGGVDANSLVEGAEFQRSIMTGIFSASGYVDLTLRGLYWDEFDDEFAAAFAATGQTLSLHNDKYSPDHDYTDRTAGAVAHAPQLELATLSGWVYHDRSDDGNFNKSAEQGIGGVTLELVDATGRGTGITTTTSTDPSKLGFYEFRNLTPGTYGVREVQPSGWLDGKDTAGSHGGAASNDIINGAVLHYGDHAVEYNFGELLPGSIRGTVHADEGPECDFDNPEIRLAGVRIDLLDAAGNFIRFTLTDAQGNYEFTGLPPAIYTVREHQPTEYYDGGERVGSAGGVKSDVAGLYSLISTIPITSGLNAIQYDFCEKVGVSLSGNVYHDRDDDGNFDHGSEEGIGGVVLKLLDGNGADTGKRATTNSAGHYEFTNLKAGKYSVVEVHPAGWLDGKDTPGNLGGVADLTPNGDMLSQITINWGQDGIEYNFGELLPGSIAGSVHSDTSGDCNFVDPDVMISGVTIELRDGAGKLLKTTKTDANGQYRFDNLPPGVYQVHELQPEGYYDGGQQVGTSGGVDDGVDTIHSIFLASAINATKYEFCEKLPSSIAGRVHADAHGDCDFDNPDVLLAGVTIELRDAAGKLLKTTTTNALGEYRFDNLPAGEYQVHELQPAGYYDGGQRVGSVGGVNDGVDTIHSIHLRAAKDAVQYDFCEKIGVNLSGNVYHDRDDDGIFDRGSEEGIGGVLLKLLDGNGNDTGKRASTNSLGFYEFTNLQAGKYSVMEVQPAGWLDGKDTPGNLGGVADLSPLGDMLSQITIKYGQSGVEYNFGELLPGSIAGRVHADAHGDCDFDHPDLLLEGVVVELRDRNGVLIKTTTTNAAGEYRFDNLAPGVYSVHELQPAAYFDGGQRTGTSGGVGDINDTIHSIALASSIHATRYDFCEKLPAQLSGYVFIDGAPISTKSQLTEETLIELRNGARTADDRPLAGITLELVDGKTGEPVLISQLLPGVYSSPDGHIRVVTDANGYYHFGGLKAGIYGVVEVSSTLNLMDGIDTPGSTGGYAANPANHVYGSKPASGTPTEEEQAIIELFRSRYGNDALTLVNLGVGDHSQENNFSEVRLSPPYIPNIPKSVPTPQPVFGPPGVPYKPVLVLPPSLLVYTPPYLPGSDSEVSGYTWHLSVVNAGWPRSITPEEVEFRLTASQMDATIWQSAQMNQGRWTLATLDYNQVVVLREGVFGRADAIPVVGDFNGDGISDIGVYLDGEWFLDLNGDGKWDEGDLWAKLGSENDLPVSGDWDADGKSDIGIYGPAWPRDPWAVLQEPGLPDFANFPMQPAGKYKNMPPKPEDATSGGRTMRRTALGKAREDVIDHVFHYGTQGDVPLAGDWNGDGIRQIGVFRDGQWNLDLDGDGRFTNVDAAITFGQVGDIPVAGDFNGDGVDEVGVFRAGKWILDTNGNRELDAQDKVFELGVTGDRPVVGDWNDDGVDDPGVYQPAEAVDHISRRAG